MLTARVSKEIQRIRRIAIGDYVHRTARIHGERIAVVDGAIRMRYCELDEASNRFAHYLLGLKPQGVQVGMLCANSAEMIVAINGIHKSGNVWLPVNAMLDGPQIKYILQHAEASVLVVDEALAQQRHIAAVIGELGLPVVITRPERGDTASGITLSAAISGQPSTLPEVEIDSNQVALVMYTSGTTANPKGVMHSHASVHAATIANLSTFGFQQGEVVSCVLPLFHVGQHCIVACAAAMGLTVVVTRGFVAGSVVELIARERITAFVGLPMMYAAMLADAKAADADLSSMRLCVYAMAPMPRPLVDKIANRLSKNIMLVTGQTEAYPVTMAFRPVENPGRDANYWGFSSAACETAIMDDGGNLLPPGEIGEIVHRGPNMMLGYLKDPAATAAAQRFGWHHTGDLGMVDAGGQMLFLDRKKDMIKSGGENVASIKVESVLLAHPAVAAAAVVGLPHAHWGEAIAAFLVRKPGTSVTEEQINAHCRGQLGKFEVPKAVKFMDALPVTATGKMQKHVLRTQFAEMFAGQPER